MRAVCLHSKDEIEAFLRRNTFLHLYAIGDLDDFFWPYTTWYALKEEGQVQEVVLFYTGIPLPVLLGLTDEPAGAMPRLLRAIVHLLPRRFYAHLSGEPASLFREDCQVRSFGTHHKMALMDRSRLESVDTGEVVPLSGLDLGELEALYRASYPDNSFDPRMLETGQYYGIRRRGRVVCVAGVHVYSPQYRVAALGNITTHPEYRGQGLATTAIAKLCQSLLRTVDHIGLNVKASNESAIGCYSRLGFERVATYEECSLALQKM